MKLVFMGSGGFAVPSLEALLDSPAHNVQALVTQPDKKAGRGHQIKKPPTKTVAEDHDVQVYQPERIRHEDSVQKITEWAPECIVVVAYGQIIPKSILEIPPRGIINVHASLLPELRGAAPIQWAIARGASETGVTTMLMDVGLDTGPVLMQERVAIERIDTSATLSPKLARKGAELLLRTLDAWSAEALTPEPQDDAKKTLAPLIMKEDGRIHWNLSAIEIEQRVRAFDPWPVASLEFRGSVVKIWSARASEETTAAVPGTLVSIDEHQVTIACADGTSLVVHEVQAAGKPRMPAASFARGRRLAPGSSFR